LSENTRDGDAGKGDEEADEEHMEPHKQKEDGLANIKTSKKGKKIL